MTIYLYVKTHNKTGLKYLGKTTLDPYTYKGSGKYWKRHIKLYGYDVTTEVIFETDCSLDLKNKGLYYSELWNIVEDSGWANLKPEAGDGGTHIVSVEQKINQSKKMKGRFFGENNPMYGKERNDLREYNKIPKAWMTDGLNDVYILHSELDNYLQLGYRRGRSKSGNKGKKLSSYKTTTCICCSKEIRNVNYSRHYKKCSA